MYAIRGYYDYGEALTLGRALGRIEFEGFRVDMSESRARFVES